MALPRVTHVVISLPRLVVTALLVGCALGGSQLMQPSVQPQPLHVQAAASKHSVPFTAAPQVVSQPVPTPTPQADITTPKPAATVQVTHSATSAPVVTPAPSASVTGLTPTNSTPATTPTNSSTPPVTNSYTSTNWSGYMATTISYTGVTGSWNVPKATGITYRSSADAAWIGIGGVSTNDLIQVGTEDSVSRSGIQKSTAFYELLPDAATTITSLSVSPGDTMTASLTEVPSGQWTISISDTTTGKTYSTTVSYASSHSSAEWIEEDPSNVRGSLVPLDIFSPVTFTGANTTSNTGSLSVTGSGALPVTMITGAAKTTVASPSPLSADGTSFTVTHS